MAIEKKIKITLDASGARKQIDDLARRMSGLGTSTSSASLASDKMSKSQGNLNRNIVNTNRSLSAMSGLLRKVASAAALISGIQLADEFNEFQNKIRLTTMAGEDFVETQQSIIDISLKTRSSLKENGLLYLRLSNAVDRNVVSQKELLRVTETVNKAVQTGGSSAQEAAGAVRQFTQIVSSGFVSGFSQEINSLSEQTPGLFNLIVDGLRETSTEFQELEASGIKGVSALKTFSKEGIGNLDILLKAISSQAGSVDSSFGKMEVTVSKALGNLKTALISFIGNVDDISNSTGGLAEKINNMALDFDDLANQVIIAGSALVAATAIALSMAAALKITSVALFVFRNGIKASIVALKAFTVASRAAFFANPIALAIGAIAVAIVVVVRKMATFKDGMVTIGKTTTTVFGFIKALLKTIGDRFKNLFENLKAFASSIVSVFSSVGVAITSAFRDSGITEFIKSSAIAIKEFINKTISGFVIMKKSIKAVYKNITKDSGGELKKHGIQIIGFFKDTILAMQGASEKARSEEIMNMNAQLATLNGSLDQFNLNQAIAKIISGEEGKDYVGDALVFIKDKVGGGLDSLSESTLDKMKALIKSAGIAWKDFVKEVESNVVPLAADEDRLPFPSLSDGIQLEDLVHAKRLDQQRELRVEIGNTVSEYKNLFSSIVDNADFGILKDRFVTVLASLTTEFVEFASPSFWKENIKLIADTFVDTFTAFTELFSTLSDIRQKKIDEELRTSTTLTDEERKNKEKSAKAAFESSKKYTLAGIALQTGLAIMNALAQPTPNYLINLANAAGAAAMGVSQYAKASSQTYSAPSPPSSSGGQAAGVGAQTQETAVTINISGGNFGSNAGEDVVSALQEFFSNDGIAFDGNSAQGRVTNG